MTPESAIVARPRANRSIRTEVPPTAPPDAAPADAIAAPGTRAGRKRAKAKPKGATRSLGARARLAVIGARLRGLASVASALAVLVASAAALRAGHHWLLTTERFNARDVVVTGAERTARYEVLRAAGISDTRNVLSIDCETAARAIEGLPWVSHAHVTRRLPGHVDVAIEERTAVALVAAGGMYLVGGDGTLFKRAVPSDPSDLPVITGIEREAFERDAAGAREGVRDALALLADVEASAVGAPLRVDEVHREATGDLSIVVEGAHVWLGRGPYRAKLTRLRVVLRELSRRSLRPSEIHLESDRHPERVTVRTASR